MRYFTFISYMLIALGVFGSALWHYRTQNQPDRFEVKEGMVFYPLSYKDIQLVELVPQQKSDSKKANNKIILERQSAEASWDMKEPFHDLLNDESVKDWLGELISREVQILKSGNDIQWSSYGLDMEKDRPHRFTLTSFNGAKKQLLLSDYSAFDGSFYMQLSEGAGDKDESSKKEAVLMLGGLEWADLNTTKPGNFRDLKVFSFKGEEDNLKSLALTHANATSLMFNRSETGHWAFSQPASRGTPPPLSQSDINEWWTTLLSMEFRGDPVYKKTPELLKKYQLEGQNPYTRLIYETDKSNILNISKKNEKDNHHYATITGRDFIFTINSLEVEKMIRKLNEFTDKRFPFQVSVSEAASIEWRSPERNFQFQKINGEWKKTGTKADKETSEKNTQPSEESLTKATGEKKVAEQKEDQDVEEEKEKQKQKTPDELIDDHFKKLNSLKVLEYFFNPPSSFVSKSGYTLKGEDGEVIYHLDFGDVSSKQDISLSEDGVASQSISAKAQHVESYFSMDYEDFKEWINMLDKLK